MEHSKIQRFGRRLVIVGTLALIAWPGASIQAAATQSITVYDLLWRMNIKRASKHLSPLRMNRRLNAVAQYRLRTMAASGQLSHASVLPPKILVLYRAFGYRARTAGENMALNVHSSDQAMALWMRSDIHRRNILSANFQETGLAMKRVTINGKEVLLVIQEFGVRSN